MAIAVFAAVLVVFVARVVVPDGVARGVGFVRVKVERVAA